MDNLRKHLQEMDVGDHILLRVELRTFDLCKLLKKIMLSIFSTELVTSLPIPRNRIPDALWEVSVIFVRYAKSFSSIITSCSTLFLSHMCLVYNREIPSYLISSSLTTTTL